MQKVKNWFIRTFGLRGSFQWALKQMKKGETVMMANAPAPVIIFRARESEALNGQMLIMWKMNNHWNGAGFAIEELEATDWIIVTNPPTTP